MDKRAHNHLTVDQRVGDLLRHPAFAGCGRLLLPWDNHRYDDDMPLSDIGSLLPYHSHVSPDAVVDALNRMARDSDGPGTIFHEFYSKQEKHDVPSRANSGLFFVRGRPGAPFALIAPGGGFRYVASLHEGFPYAAAIADSGYHAFVLKYRVGHHGDPAREDIAAALGWIVDNANALEVDTEGYALWGSSAGASIAAHIATSVPGKAARLGLPSPSALVMAYCCPEDIGPSLPPAFVVAGAGDTVAAPCAIRARIATAAKAGAQIEYREYPGIGHGFGPGTGTPAQGWISTAIDFWRRHA